MDIKYLNDLADNSVDLLHTFEVESSTNDKTFAKILSRLPNVFKKLNLLKEEINNVSGGVEVLGTIPARNLEEWKDNATMSLPNGASLAMANDVEAALDKFKSVY